MRLEEITVDGVKIPTRNIVILPPKISPADLIEIIRQEADRRAICTVTTKKDEKDAAFVAGAKSKGGKKGGKSNIECYNCGKRRHIKVDCWAKGGGKEGQGPKEKGKASPKKDPNAAASANAEDDAAWMVEDTIDDITIYDDDSDIFDGLFDEMDLPFNDDKSLPDLLTCSDSEEESDAFSVSDLYMDDPDESEIAYNSENLPNYMTQVVPGICPHAGPALSTSYPSCQRLS